MTLTEMQQAQTVFIRSTDSMGHPRYTCTICENVYAVPIWALKHAFNKHREEVKKELKKATETVES